MSEAGRIFAQAGANIAGMISDRTKRREDMAIRVEQLRLEEARNQLSFNEFLQRGTLGNLQLQNQADQIQLASDRLQVAELALVEERARFDLLEPQRQAALELVQAQEALVSEKVETERAQGKLVREALKPIEEDKEPGKFQEAITNIFTSLLAPPSGAAPETLLGFQLNPLGQAVAKGATAVEAALTPATPEQARSLALTFGGITPTAIAKTTAPQDKVVVNGDQKAIPLFSTPESDISVEEEEQARVIFEQLIQEQMELLEKGLKGDTIKEIFKRTAQATANIRRRNL